MLFSKQGVFTLIALGAMLATSCGGDKTPDEYQREQSNKALAIQQIAAGKSAGLVKNDQTGKTLTSMLLATKAVLVPTNDASGAGSIGQAQLIGTVTLQAGGITSSASITRGAYTPFTSDDNEDNQRGSLSGNVVINLGNSGASVNFTLSGVFDHGHISGSLTATNGQSSIEASFDLQNGASVPRVGQGSLNPGDTSQLNFLGTAPNPVCNDPTFRPPPGGGGSILCPGGRGTESPVRLEINRNPPNAGYAFLNLIADKKVYDVKLNYGGVIVDMPNANYDPASGQLFFHGVDTGDSGNVSLSCQPSGNGLSCIYTPHTSSQALPFHVSGALPRS